MNMKRNRNILARLAIGMGIFCVVLACSGCIYQWIGTALDERRLSPHGELIDVEEGHLHIHCTGKGSPTVVLDAGGGGNYMSWHRVQPAIAADTRVCAFDRMGSGWSSPLSQPHRSREYAIQQEILLHRAEIEAPYVLVGHSLGGQNAQIFAGRNPDDVLAMVLVDSAHPDLYTVLPEFEGQGRRTLSTMRIAARLGVVRFMLATGLSKPLPYWEELSDEQRHMFRALISRPSHWDAAYEMNARLTESAKQAREAEPMPDVPLVVITHGIGDMFEGLDPETAARAEEVWRQLQNDLASRSSQGRLVVAGDSGHQIPVEQPEIVVEAIRQVINAHNSYRPR